MRYLDPTNDLTFRKIFGDEKHQDSLLSFLNAVLGLKGEHTIVSVSIANPYQLPKLAMMKETIIDVRAKDASGKEFIVEMQCDGGSAWRKRAVYATCKAYVNQLDRGEEYKLLQPVYFIGVLDFRIGWDDIQIKIPGSEVEKTPPTKWLSRFSLREAETNLEMTQDFSIHFLELPRFKKTLEECEGIVEQWAWFFKNAEYQEFIPELLKDQPGFVHAFDTAEKLGWNANELDEYDNIRHARALNRATMEDKLEEGRVLGERVGLEKGERIGLEKGEKIGQQAEKRATAVRLHGLGIAVEVIAQAVGMAPDEVLGLLNDPTPPDV